MANTPCRSPCKCKRRLSMKDYAAHAGVSRQTVWRWLKAGIITRPESGPGKGRINREVADAARRKWEAHDKDPRGGDQSVGSGVDAELMRGARLEKARADAEAVRLRNAEKKRELLPREEVTQVWGDVAALLVQQLDAVPARIAEQLARADTVQETEEIVRRALADARRASSLGIRALAGLASGADAA